MPRPTLDWLNEEVLRRNGYAVCSNSPVAGGVSVPKPQPARGPALVQAPQDEGRSKTVSSPRYRVSFLLKRVSLLDGDNKYGAVKYVLDALRYEGLIPDDKESDIDLNVKQLRVPHYIEEGTEISIERIA